MTAEFTPSLSQSRQMGQRFAPFSFKAIESVVMAPDNRPQGVFRMSHQELSLLGGGQWTPVSLQEGGDQIGATDPRPVWVSAEIGHAHIPISKLEIYDARPVAVRADEPIGGAIVAMAGPRSLAGKRRYQLVGCLRGGQLTIINIPGLNGAFDRSPRWAADRDDARAVVARRGRAG